MIVNVELKGMWKETVMIYDREIFQHLSVGTEETHIKPQTRRAACGPTLETVISEYEAADLSVNRHVRLPKYFIYRSRWTVQEKGEGRVWGSIFLGPLQVFNNIKNCFLEPFSQSLCQQNGPISYKLM
jgi:hypothetical protein